MAKSTNGSARVYFFTLSPLFHPYLCSSMTSTTSMLPTIPIHVNSWPGNRVLIVLISKFFFDIAYWTIFFKWANITQLVKLIRIGKTAFWNCRYNWLWSLVEIRRDFPDFLIWPSCNIPYFFTYCQQARHNTMMDRSI